MKGSKRVQQLAPSATLAAAAKAKALKLQGADVLSLTLGEPDFKTPQIIQEAAIKAIQSGVTSYYTPVSGVPELIEAILYRTKEDMGLVYQPSEVMVGSGAKFVLYSLFQALLDQDDEVILIAPYWVSYHAQIELAEGKSIIIQGKQEHDFKVSVAELEQYRTNKTKALVLNSPSNPTGSIYTEKELKEIGEWAVLHNILIIADDIYGKLVYNGNIFTSIATVSEAIKKQTIVVNGVSKSYAMTGWRIGYALGDETIISQMAKIASQATSNPTAVSQYAAIEALTGPQDVVEEMRATFENRLNRIYPLVANIPGFKVKKPQGAFYLYPNVSDALERCGYDNVTNWVTDLLTEEHVAVVTGEGFGTTEHIRLSYATDLGTLEEAVKRITRFIERKQKNKG